MPLDWLWGHFDDEVSNTDLEIVANKLSREGAWVSKDCPENDVPLEAHTSRNAATNGVLLLRARDIIRRGDVDTFLFGTAEDRSGRHAIGERLKRVEELLESAREHTSRMGHNAPADHDADDMARELANLRMSVTAIGRELRRHNANVAEIVAQTISLQSHATAAARPQPSLGRIAAEKAAETFGRAGAIATLYVLHELFPALAAVVQYVVAWLIEVVPGLG